MSTPTEILTGPMKEAALLLPTLSFAPNVCILMLAAGVQESGLIARRQYGNGPARGLWQFEKGTPSTRGGVTGLMLHAATSGLLLGVCKARKVSWDASVIWAALETDDVLAACLARLALWVNPRSIPDRSDPDAAYAYYLWCWRPGKPDAERWPAAHARAVQAVIGADL